MSSPRRNLIQEIENIEKFRNELSMLSKDQLIEKLEKQNEEHKKAIAELKSKIENDLAIA